MLRAYSVSMETDHALDSLFGRIFYGKPVSTFPENALGLGEQAAHLTGRRRARCRRRLRCSHQAPAERGQEFGLRHRLGEEITLPDVAADTLQLMAFMGRFDAFGDGLEFKALGEFNDGLAQPGIHFV